MTDRPSAEWIEVSWTDEHGAPVRKLVCHHSELAEVLILPFPAGAVAREPGMAWHGGGLANIKFFRRCVVKVGTCFDEFINQGMRPCEVVAVDEKTGRFLYEYEMPSGTTSLRIGGWEQGRYFTSGVSYKALSKRWRKLIEQEGRELAEKPQRKKW